MNKTEEIRFMPCKWEEIQSAVVDHINSNKIIVEGYWEEHVVSSNHYKMICGDDPVGYFAIFKVGDDPHKDATLTLFNVFEPYASQSQELFSRVRKYETVTNAMVATGDEVFLSHCLDNFMKVEKMAYFFEYTDKETPKSMRPLEFKLAKSKDDFEAFKLAKGFLDEEIAKFEKGATYLEVYIVEENSEIIGFGIVEYGRAIKSMASIGMYVCEKYRRRGLAVDILQGMKRIVNDKGLRAVSGCWYYNHNSKKSLEKAGGYCKTRLIRFCF
ncbi:MAG: GNAT family N-acetyltransferase [Defluviitaleaceae bacterium]|nr:GNAT family N-acetyltransferase [Defluviitaleaceae bacterium]